MGSMKDRFFGDTPYPATPGYKERGGTSQAAAQAVAGTAGANRERILNLLAHHPGGLTADEIAEHLNMDKLAVRPRVSELRTASAIEKTGARRANASGMSAWVWRARTRQ